MSDFILITQILLFVLLAGSLAGFIGGMFGIGGGVIIVPMLYWVFTIMGYAPHAMHMAIGTSLATILVTSLRSLAKHHEMRAVDWPVIKNWAIWIAIGVMVSAIIANQVSGAALTTAFGCIMLILSLKFIFYGKNISKWNRLPTGVMRSGLGILIGGVSTLIGVGGGVFGVTMMSLCGMTIHRAVATAAGFGLTIAIPASIGFILNGWTNTQDIPLTLGYISLPGFITISSATIFTAPMGAKFAHKLDAKLLSRLFGIGLVIMGIHMLIEGQTNL